MSQFFDGSWNGEPSSIDAGTRLECKICWYVYDPGIGDPVWQVPAGTPFFSLPQEWRCPECDGDRDGFMVVGD